MHPAKSSIDAARSCALQRHPAVPTDFVDVKLQSQSDKHGCGQESEAVSFSVLRVVLHLLIQNTELDDENRTTSGASATALSCKIAMTTTKDAQSISERVQRC